jgi:hypothetical protein
MLAIMQLRNEPKEGIKAAVFNVYGRGTVHPVPNVVKAKRYLEHEQDQGQGNQSFSEILKQKADKKEEKETKRNVDAELRVMGGLQQYNRHAVEFCYILSSEADYRA